MLWIVWCPACISFLIEDLLLRALLLGGSAPGGPAPRGFCSWAIYSSGTVCFLGGSAPGGGIPACTEADPPPVDRMTDTCKNRTFATTLRTVKIYYASPSLIIFVNNNNLFKKRLKPVTIDYLFTSK